MSVTARFVPNPAIEREILHDAGVEHAIEEDAQKVADLAKSIAPVDTGAFRDSIHVEPSPTGEGFIVVADSVDDQGNIDAGYIEFGTTFSPPHGTLRNALGAVR